MSPNSNRLKCTLATILLRLGLTDLQVTGIQNVESGAGEGNRTLVCSLASYKL